MLRLKRGRPVKKVTQETQLSKPLTLKLRESQIPHLDMLAVKRGVSRSQIVREAVQIYLDRIFAGPGQEKE